MFLLTVSFYPIHKVTREFLLKELNNLNLDNVTSLPDL